MPHPSNITPPTLEEMRQAAPWLWLWCRNVHCRHKGPMALVPLIIRWGGDASSDVLRQSARCKCCRSKGADLQHPSARSSDIALVFHARAEDWHRPTCSRSDEVFFQFATSPRKTLAQIGIFPHRRQPQHPLASRPGHSSSPRSPWPPSGESVQPSPRRMPALAPLLDSRPGRIPRSH
jgi:hypothetical protein